MSELLGCPFCGSDNVELHYEEQVMGYESENSFILCRNCMFESGFYYNRQAVIEKWNRRAPISEPKALTLDELREMSSGHEIDIKYPQTIFLMGNTGFPATRYKFSFSDYGITWLAYDREPGKDKAHVHN